MSKISVIIFFILTGFSLFGQRHSEARVWNEQVLEAIRNDFARPTVHARNLWHTSVAMYDIWSVVNESGSTYLLGQTFDDVLYELPELNLTLTEEEKIAYTEEAIAYAMYDIILERFRFAPKSNDIISDVMSTMSTLGYDPEIPTRSIVTDQSAAAFGRYVAIQVLAFGSRDESNEQFDYGNLFYRPINDATLVTSIGNPDLQDPNRWQPLAFDEFIDQSGNPFLGNIPQFLGAEWGKVRSFALSEEDKNIYTRDGFEYTVYHDPGAPPYLSESGDDISSEEYKYGFSMVGIWSSMLDPDDGVLWDISPASIGNTGEISGGYEAYQEFYNLYGGGDPSQGHNINPITGQPYETQIVPRGDYTRVLAEFWADGPDSETPPGHWFSIMHEVMDHPMFEYRWEGQYLVDNLEYEVKAFFTLAGAMHDAAVSAWGIKGYYDYIRPISVIRYMASKGQSSDESLSNYDPHGLPIIDGYIEIITDNDPLAIDRDELVGKMKIRSWRGPDFIEDETTEKAGVGWIPAENWWPYQRPTFVSPPFAGYVSGHSTFSRAAADILTMMTGDAFFPGGMGRFPIEKNEFLVFENGPSVDFELQWATYRDASDQTSLSRIWGGIHPPQDDLLGRLIGVEIAIDVFEKASQVFGEFPTSTYEQELITDAYQVYPSPISNTQRLSIKAYDNEAEPVKVELYDMNARRVRSELIRPSITQLDIEGLAPGLYLLHIISGQTRQVNEIIIVE